MKKSGRIWASVLALVCATSVGAQEAAVPATEAASRDGITKDMCVAWVQKAVAAAQVDVAAMFKAINASEEPYQSKDNPELYVFVYDLDVNIVAHPKAALVGKNYKGKPDAKGKKFRDDIVAGALKDGKGWVDYMYQKPGEEGLHPKTTCFEIVTASDGKQYVLCCGKYLD